jgi:hypothetical protein
MRKQTGPLRDALPTAPPDAAPPTAPSGLTLAAGHLGINSLMLRWTLATDDRAVAGARDGGGAVDAVCSQLAPWR